MLTFTRKPLGMWLVTVFALGASLFTSVLVPATVHAAMAGTWVDKNTINIGTNVFKGPSAETLPYGPYGAPTKYQVFNGAAGVLKVYFPETANLNTATTATYIDTSRGVSSMQDVTFAKTLAAVTAGTGTTAPPTTTTTTGTPTPVCDVGGLSFLLCPLISLAGSLVNTVGQIIGSMMRVNPLPLSGGPVFNAWSNVLNIANVILAIAFLFVIFAQATSMALSSYGIKRMLPKIIAAAILMNLSYYICALAIDLSNLAGSGITTLLMTVSDVKNGTTAIGNSGDIGSLLYGAVEFAITGIAVAGIVAVLLFAALVPTVFSILAVLFVLAARQAILILLVMIAPLAFALWVLPNTEKYFKKWWEWFIQMLVLYPMVMAVFAAAVIASNIIVANTQKPNTEEFNKVTDNSAFQGLIALIVMSLPLFAVPALFKASSNVLGRIHMMSGNYMKKGQSAYQNTNYAKYRQKRASEDSRSTAIGSYRGWRPDLKARSATNRRLNRNGAFNTVTRGYGGFRRLDEGRLMAEEQDGAMKRLGDWDFAQKWVAAAGANGDLEKAKAMIHDRGLQPLSVGQIEKFKEMTNAGEHKKAESFIAAQKMMAANGVGTPDTIGDAFTAVSQRISDSGLRNKTLDDLAEETRSQYRSKGRGDLVARTGTVAPGLAQDGFGTNWQEVAPATISRHAFNGWDKPPGSAARIQADAKIADLTALLTASDEKRRQYVAAFDQIDARTQPIVEKALWTASGGKTVDQLRTFYGLRK